MTVTACFIAVSLVVAVQLAYPRGLTRPLARVDSVAAGLKSVKNLETDLKTADNAKRTITVGNTTYHLSLASVGVSTDTAASTDQATDYPLTERLKPFSLLKKTDMKPVKKINNAKLSQIIDDYISKNTEAPNNPRVELAPSGLVVKPGKTGIGYDADKLKTMLIGLKPAEAELKYTGQIVKPKVDEQQLQTAVKAVNEQSVKQFTLNVQGKPYVATPDQLRDWIKINIDENTGAISTVYDTNSIKQWLAATALTTLKASTPAKNVMVDDVIVQKQAGLAGTIIDADKTASTISQALTLKSNKTDAVTAVAAIPVQVIKSYSATSRGLQLLIANWSKTYPGMSAGVTFREIGGQARQAGLNSDKQFYPASVYKLFTTLYLTSEINAGRIDPNSEILPGKTIASCMELMIVASNNDCPSTIGQNYGWGAIDTAAKSRGFAATTINGPLSTSANDLANFLGGLNNGSLMSAPDSAALLDRMGRQIYRSAIPAGSSGCGVADKPGFVNNYWNDAAIVSCPNTKYILVVMTQNGGAKAIKDLASQISSIIK
jgi:beta-lactamase class A